MSSDVAIRIDKRRLGTLTPLGEGGMAHVLLVGANIAQLSGTLVFKQLKPTVTEPRRTEMLTMMRRAVALRDAMSSVDQHELDTVTLWPLAMVQEHGTDVGTIMRCLTDDFFIDALPRRRVFEFQLLSADPAQARALGIEESRTAANRDLVRLALMARLAHAIEIVHRPRGNVRLVYGDLSLRNAAVGMSPPRIMLMDCDGVADVGDVTRIQPNTPFFVPPELASKQQRLQDQETDIYKLGLCVIRGLAAGRGATQLTEPSSPLIPAGLLDQAGIDLLIRAVGADRLQRPTAAEIKNYLVGRVLDLTNPPKTHPPELYFAQLSNHIALRGSDVFVSWAHEGGKKIRIFSNFDNYEVKDINADAFPNGYAIQPPTSCEIWVEVSNDFGSDSQSAGRLDYFDVPAAQRAHSADDRLAF